MVNVGQVLRSAECGTGIVVLDFSAIPHELTCDGLPLRQCRPVPCSDRATMRTGEAMKAGRHYVDRPSGLRVRCISPGPAIRCDGRMLTEYTPVRRKRQR